MKGIGRIFKRSVFSTIAVLALVTVAFAGEIHEGYGASKTVAVEAANRAARQAAKDKDTCWEPAKMSECTKDSDGYWTCFASSANHRGSCGPSKRKP